MQAPASEADEEALHHAGIARHLMLVSMASLLVAVPLLVLIGTFIGPLVWFISIPLGAVVLLAPPVLAITAASASRRAARPAPLSSTTQAYVDRTRLLTEGYFAVLLLGGCALLLFG